MFIKRRFVVVGTVSALALASVIAALAAEEDWYTPQDDSWNAYGYACAYTPSGGGDYIYSSVDGNGGTAEVRTRSGYWNGSTTIYPLGYSYATNLVGQTYGGTFATGLGSGSIMVSSPHGTTVTSGFLDTTTGPVGDCNN